MANMTSEHSKRWSTLTVFDATWRSRCVPVKTEDRSTDSSEFRVGSLHMPSSSAIAVPTSLPPIGIVQ